MSKWCNKANMRCSEMEDEDYESCNCSDKICVKCKECEELKMCTGDMCDRKEINLWRE